MEKKGDDFMLTIPQGTCGKDVEIALATAIVEISKHQRQTHPTFKKLYTDKEYRELGKNNRKQPVTFNVPSSTDYRFTNINNFRGVNISENPLQLSPESASDMLNLYVDDSGTLTTRPRLELDTDITPIFGDALNKSLIKVFETSKGTLFLVYRGNASSELVFKYLDNNVQKVITVAPPQGMGVTGNSSSNFFEKNGKVFILNCLT